MDLQSYFDALMAQQTVIQPPDLSTFLKEMRRTPSGPLITSKLLAARIQSDSQAQALKAFEFLESALESESEGSIEFRTEIGRYRFLNELIRTVSPKYMGDKVPGRVKDRAVGFITQAAGAKRRKWFPSEHSKIEAVMKSLVECGIIQAPTTPPDLDAEFHKSIFERGENSALLKKLLQSKDPTELQSANRLIKNLVEEEAKRNERRSEIHSLLDRIDTSTSLLTEMASQPVIDTEIVEELAEACRSLRLKLGAVGTETNEEVLGVLRASESIEGALEVYEQRKGQSPAPVPPLAPPKMSLADELLLGLDLGGPAEVNVSDNLVDLDTDIVDTEPPPAEQENKTPAWDEIGRMSRMLMEQSLKGLTEVKKTDRSTLNQLQRQATEPLQQQQPKKSKPDDNSSFLDLDFLEEPKGQVRPEPINSQHLPDDPPLLVIDNQTQASPNNKSLTQAPDPSPSVPLTGIKEIDLDKVEILEVEPVSVQPDPEVQLGLTFGKLEGLEEYIVVIVTLTNQSMTGSLSNYVFHCLPPRGVQVKLFPASCMELSAWKKRFLPPAVLTQAALVSSSASAIPLDYILSYCVGDETAVHNGSFLVPPRRAAGS